jgi:hypothetical protein
MHQGQDRICACGCERSLKGKRQHARYFEKYCRTRASRLRLNGPTKERGHNLWPAIVRPDLARKDLMGDVSQHERDPRRAVTEERSTPASGTLKVYERPLWKLEEMDRRESRNHQKRIREGGSFVGDGELWPGMQTGLPTPLAQLRRQYRWNSAQDIPAGDISGSKQRLERFLNDERTVEPRKRINQCIEGADMNTAELEGVLERQLARHLDKQTRKIIDAIAANSAFDPVAEAEEILEAD